MKNPRSFRKIIFAIIALLVIAGVAWLLVKTVWKYQEATNSVSIIISPHLNDAVLSLGGMIAANERPTIIADFFEASSSLATIPNTAIPTATIQALSYNSADYAGDTTTEESDLAQTIQALLVANAGKNAYIYGPATFNGLNDPDTQILHQAFLDVATGYPGANTQFFIYENYPAIATFNQTVVYSLKKNLEDESDQNESYLGFTEVDIPLSASQVNKKIAELTALGENAPTIAADQQFTNTRCGSNPDQACEAVYQISQPQTQATSSLPIY